MEDPTKNSPQYSDRDIQNASYAPDPLNPAASSSPIPELAPHDYLHPIVDKPKHSYSQKRMVLILSILVGVALLAIILMILLATRPAAETTKQQTKESDTTNSVKALSAKETINHITAYYKGEEAVKTGITLPVKAPTSDHYTVIPETLTLTGLAGYVDVDSSDTQRDSIEKSLDYDGYTKQVMSDGTNGGNYLADFSQKAAVCELSVDKTDKTKHWFEIKCQDMSVYEQYAKDQEPLTSQYTALTSTSNQYAFVGKIAPKPSKTSGYNTTEMQVSIVVDNKMQSTGRYAIFYQSPDGLWHYFQDHDKNTLVDCAHYETTPALRYAFTGEQCRDLNKNGLVRTVLAPNKK